jgi:hypothetical protein
MYSGGQVNTLEIRQLHDFDFILWPDESPEQVRDRLYAGQKLLPASVLTPKSLGGGRFCRAWRLERVTVTLVEVLV